MLASIRKVQSFFSFSHEIILKTVLKSGFKFVHLKNAALYIIKALIQSYFYCSPPHNLTKS